MPLILASASPRRAELLTAAGFAFEIHPADVDETVRAGEPAEEYALRVAREKAEVVFNRRRKSGITVLAADTVVVLNGEILGKPNDSWDARRMLRLLSNAVHDVHTGVAVRTVPGERAAVTTTRVRFRSLDDTEIEWYVSSGEPEGKAGAYAIQGRASRFIDYIEGSWSNVVGLPIADVYRLLKELSVVD
jgi:septum formation protein